MAWTIVDRGHEGFFVVSFLFILVIDGRRRWKRKTKTLKATHLSLDSPLHPLWPSTRVFWPIGVFV